MENINRVLSLIAAATLFLQACAQAPNQSQFSTAYFGAEMQQDQCRQTSTQAIGSRLKDPMSAQYTFGLCEKGWLPSVPVMGLPIAYGYLQRGTVNAKNSFGGYTGVKSFYVLMVDGLAIRAAMEDGKGYMVPWRPGPGVGTYLGRPAEPQPMLGQQTKPLPPKLAGEDLYAAKQIAKAASCVINQKIKDEGKVEIYSATCKDGGVLVITCEWSNCKGL